VEEGGSGAAATRRRGARSNGADQQGEPIDSNRPDGVDEAVRAPPGHRSSEMSTCNTKGDWP
jgi:hypothetical protein